MSALEWAGFIGGILGFISFGVVLYFDRKIRQARKQDQTP